MAQIPKFPQGRVFDNKLVYVDRYGWPVVGIENHPVITFLRRLTHTRKIVRYGMWLKNGGCQIKFPPTQRIIKQKYE